jgi:glutathione peroxidase
VLGFPCNQFMGQEPGTAEEIKEFCSLTYGVTFPLMDKVRVNGRGRHPLFAALTKVEDDKGRSGDVRWNFEKFVIAPDDTVRRFSNKTLPDDPRVISAIEGAIASAPAAATTPSGAV